MNLFWLIYHQMEFGVYILKFLQDLRLKETQALYSYISFWLKTLLILLFLTTLEIRVCFGTCGV